MRPPCGIQFRAKAVSLGEEELTIMYWIKKWGVSDDSLEDIEEFTS